MALTNNLIETKFTHVVKQSSATKAMDVDVFNGTKTLNHIYFSNSGAGAAYIKLYDDNDATAGTTEPNIVFYLPAGATSDQQIYISGSLNFTEGVSLLCTKESGSTVSSNPDNTVKYTLLGGL